MGLIGYVHCTQCCAFSLRLWFAHLACASCMRSWLWFTDTLCLFILVRWSWLSIMLFMTMHHAFHDSGHAEGSEGALQGGLVRIERQHPVSLWRRLWWGLENHSCRGGGVTTAVKEKADMLLVARRKLEEHGCFICAWQTHFRGNCQFQRASCEPRRHLNRLNFAWGYPDLKVLKYQ